METKMRKIPTLSELINDSDTDLKNNRLTVLLNQDPPTSWVKDHPTARTKEGPVKYLPIDKVEYLLTKIYGGYKSTIKEYKIIANSMTVSVTLEVKNPITGLTESHDGLGAAPIQVNSGKSPVDFSEIKSNGIQLALPAAESYAIKDAAEKFGRIFGRDITRKHTLDYISILKEDINIDTLKELFEKKRSLIAKAELNRIEEIIKNEEKTCYKKTYEFLNKI